MRRIFPLISCCSKKDDSKSRGRNGTVENSRQSSSLSHNESFANPNINYAGSIISSLHQQSMVNNGIYAIRASESNSVYDEDFLSEFTDYDVDEFLYETQSIGSLSKSVTSLSSAIQQSDKGENNNL